MPSMPSPIKVINRKESRDKHALDIATEGKGGDVESGLGKDWGHGGH